MYINIDLKKANYLILKILIKNFYFNSSLLILFFFFIITRKLRFNTPYKADKRILNIINNVYH